MSEIPRYRIDAWRPYGFVTDRYGNFCEYKYYENIKSQLVWNTMDNAPLDKNILVFWGVINSPVTAFWNEDHWCVYLSKLRIHPTHWMNLPESPEFPPDGIVAPYK